MLLPEIGSRLVSQVSLVLGINLFLSRLPDTPNVLVALFEYSGREPARTFGDGTAWEKPRFQVQVRDDDYATARLTAQSCYNALEFWETTLSGVRYLSCLPLQSPFLLRRDDNERVIIVFNCEVEKEVSAS
jgi:hypothetical protein